jgi:hypothetical protein
LLLSNFEQEKRKTQQGIETLGRRKISPLPACHRYQLVFASLMTAALGNRAAAAAAAAVDQLVTTFRKISYRPCVELK